MNSILTIKNLSKTFSSTAGALVPALKEITVSIAQNEFVCIVGPSGCGKSTLLRIIAGLERASAGEVFYNQLPLLETSPDIGMVFQNYSLLKWRTVEDNIALGLEFKGVSREKRLQTAHRYLAMIQMERFAKAYPYELSGGMQQRVAIARALANDPTTLLMDEPFGALDAYTRIILQKELLEIWEKNKKTILFVTHSVDEAVYLSDKIIVMSSHPGQVQEVIQVDLKRPRDRSNPQFGELTHRLLTMLETM